MKRPLILILLLAIATGILYLNFTSPDLRSRPNTNHIARLEKFEEKLILNLKFDRSRKADYYQFLLEKRLAELKFAATNKDQLDYVEETASRYTTYLGYLSDFIIQNKMTNRKDELLQTFSEHTQIIEELQKNYQFDSGWWLAIQHDINTLKIFSDQIKPL